MFAVKEKPPFREEILALGGTAAQGGAGARLPGSTSYPFVAGKENESKNACANERLQ